MPDVSFQTSVKPSQTHPHQVQTKSPTISGTVDFNLERNHELDHLVLTTEQLFAVTERGRKPSARCNAVALQSNFLGEKCFEVKDTLADEGGIQKSIRR